MLVRIRFGKGPQVGKKRKKNQRLALGVAALLTPAAAVTAAFGWWRIAAGWGWTNSFAIPSGFFSHWQVWLGAAAVLQLCSHALGRYGKSGDRARTS